MREKVSPNNLPNTNKEESKQKHSTVSIPKPKPLTGGSEVYQKDNGTPYWYCKIKEGRDEFMHLYFEDLTEDDLMYNPNGTKRKFVTVRQNLLAANIIQALNNKPKEGYRWIPSYEPTRIGNNLAFVPGETVLCSWGQISYHDWKVMATNYSPNNGSRVAFDTTYFLLLLRWLKDGIATIEQLADDSKDIGHYYDSEDAKDFAEKTGERFFGGLFGFAGNTFKIVQTSSIISLKAFSILGGCYDVEGMDCPIAHILPLIDKQIITSCLRYTTMLLELTE